MGKDKDVEVAKIENKNNYKILVICLIIIYFFLSYKYRGVGTFVDEYDNIIGGMTVAKGGLVYIDYLSQHTPIMYYLNAIFTLLGADNLLSYRLFFYVFTSIIYTLAFMRYSKYFGKIAMFVFPIINILSYEYIDATLSHMILSDNVQGIALAILFLEFLVYHRTREYNIKNAIWMSFGIFMSVGVAFLSIYFVALVCLSIIIMEYNQIYRGAHNHSRALILFVKKHLITFVIMACPFLILLFYFVLTDSLNEMIYQSYTFNREIYSKYIGGYGSNIVSAILATVDAYFGMLSYAINNVSSTTLLYSLRILLNIIANVFICVYVYQKNKFASIACALLIFSSGIRGYLGFHSISYWTVSAFMIAYLLQTLIQHCKIYNNKRIINQIILLLAVCIIVTPYASKFSQLMPRKADFIQTQYTENTQEYYINNLLHKDENFYASTLNYNLHLNTNRISSTRVAGLVPWFSEIYENEIINDLEKTETKLIIFSPESDVWGYKFKDFAPDLYDYILSNYTGLPGDVPNIYVRNNFYLKAMEILDLNEPIFSIGPQNLTNIGAITDGRQVEQAFLATADTISKVKVQIGTYVRQNNSNLEMYIKDMESGQVLYAIDMNVPNLVDNAFEDIEVPDITIERDNMYIIGFKATKTTDNDFVTIYRTETNLNENAGYAIVDNKRQDYNLNIKVYGK